ncbi:cell wall-binding repeat-containing protein [Clostridium tyrobutyricum]|uniref:cell wall-binding repeat-containing protein n=1 Tax=Clostridium tyrobutyricum TaxID=1519 RepID=UPI001C38DD8E|nr:cell wall-binding repeat-containing protein [Clostridium tyrobutyricum]MBV4418707.1 cell wall-binding repeat-containing protein [Clostridium tyrobutyricum]
MNQHLKKLVSKTASFMLCFLVVSSGLIVPISAKAAENTETSQSVTSQEINPDIKDIAFAPGADQSQINFAWYSKSTSDPQVQIALKSDMTGSTFPEDKAKTFNGQKSEGNDGYTSNKVTVTGLKQATAYVYRVGDGTNWSSVDNYTTQDISKGINFLFAGDPQIGASGDIAKDGDGWVDTLNKALAKFTNTDFIMSIGDQVNNGKESQDESGVVKNEGEYDQFFKPSQIKNTPLVTIAGNHEGYGPGNSTHFNYTNMSDKYGIFNNNGFESDKSNGTTGNDYYYVYGNTLFMMLNSNDINAEDHKAFMQQAIAANPNVKWKIVGMHHSIYSSANHEKDDDIAQRRLTHPEVFESLGIDVVLDGHDHCYTRSNQMLGGKAVSVEDSKDGKVTNPQGILYVTANSASGSKYYEIKEPDQKNYYEAVKWQEHVPTFSNVSIDDNNFTITTYRTDNMQVVDTYTITKKTSSGGGSSSGGSSGSNSSINVTNSNKDSVVNAIKNSSDNATVTVDVDNNKQVAKDIFDAVKGTDKKVVFTSNGVQWIFDGKDMSDTTKAVDMTVDVAKVEDSKSLNKTEIKQKTNNADVAVVSFADNGQLPGKATVKIKLDSSWLENKNKNNMKVYYYNESNKTITSVADNLKVDSDNYISFDITHNSDYIISDKDLASPKQVRLGGQNRYETSAKISQNKWTSADSAVVVSGEAFADALSAAPFAKQINAPILLTSSNSLDNNASSELSRLKVKNVYIIGGTGVVSSSVENAVKKMKINVQRISGSDRYATSLEVAKKISKPEQIFIASGQGFADGLSISSYAASSGSPVLLINGNKLTNATLQYVKDNSSKMYAVGGTGVVSDSIVKSLGAERISGADRYATNLAVLNKFNDKYDLSNIYLASGNGFADALCGSSAAGKESAPIILLNRDGNSNDLKNYIKSGLVNANQIYVLGGEGVVSQNTVDKLLQ